MRTAIITFIASLLGTAVALLGFRELQRWDAQREVKHSATVIAKVDEQGQQLDQRMAAEQRSIELIRADFAAVASAKVAVTESYMTMGRMPVSNAEAGLAPPTSYRGRSLLSAEVIGDGRIRLTFDPQSGHDGGTIDLVADIGSIDAMGVQWRCETRDYPQIMRALPSCDYLPAQAAPTSTTER